MLATIWGYVYPILIAIAFFEVIIIIHEGGHYIAARLMKIKVEEFSVGMGPKIFSFKRGDTTYSLRWILIGGYCSMEGEDDAPESSKSDAKSDTKTDTAEAAGKETKIAVTTTGPSPTSYASKTVLQRIFVVISGALMNLILGFIVLVILTCSRDLVGTTTVAKFDDNAVSSSYGLEVGDTIKNIDGMRIYTSTDVSTGLTRSADGNVEMVVERGGKDVTLNVTFNMEDVDGTSYISMDFWLLGHEKTFFNVIENSAATFVSYARMVFLSVHDIVVGRYHLTDLSGPVGAVSAVSTAVSTSLASVLSLMALLAVNVGLFNLFPIPALDGWRLFLLIGEGIFRRKLPARWEYAINAVGLVLLLLLMVFVTFSDISKLI